MAGHADSFCLIFEYASFNNSFSRLFCRTAAHFWRGLFLAVAFFANLSAVSQDPTQADSQPLHPTAVASRRWPWWPLLPLYPYGCRPTLVRELVPDRVWSFEQLHGVWYVAVPIRMTVVRVEDGLLLYAPVPPTPELLGELRALEQRIGPVRAIVLPTASGLEHKLPVPAMARAFPKATVWVSDAQWSFPVRLPSTWLGFPRDRTRVLGPDGFPYPDQLRWIPLGPLDLGLGTFLELACFDQASGSLLVTDALVAIPPTPPQLFDLDPTPLLFHAREVGSDPLVDTPANRLKGWKRIVLFANYFRPESVFIPDLGSLLLEVRRTTDRTPRCHFGFYPFRWSEGWESVADEFLLDASSDIVLILAPVLEKLVFTRSKGLFVEWLTSLSRCSSVVSLIGAHYAAPLKLESKGFEDYIERINRRQWSPSDKSWNLLAEIDRFLVANRLVP